MFDFLQNPITYLDYIIFVVLIFLVRFFIAVGKASK